jgi:hypothetical protein
MIDASEAGKPALTPLVNHIEQLMLNIKNPKLSFDENFTKQAIGMMVRSILMPFGYVPCGQRILPKNAGATKFVSASIYQYNPEKAPPTMKVVKHIEEIASTAIPVVH